MLGWLAVGLASFVVRGMAGNSRPPQRSAIEAKHFLRIALGVCPDVGTPVDTNMTCRGRLEARPRARPCLIRGLPCRQFASDTGYKPRGTRGPNRLRLLAVGKLPLQLTNIFVTSSIFAGPPLVAEGLAGNSRPLPPDLDIGFFLGLKVKIASMEACGWKLNMLLRPQTSSCSLLTLCIVYQNKKRIRFDLAGLIQDPKTKGG